MNISTTKKGGAYSAPTSMSVPSLKQKMILLSACTVAVSKSVSHSPSSHVSRTRGCSFIAPMKIRSSRSRCIRLSRSSVAFFSRSTARSYRLTSRLYFLVYSSWDCWVVAFSLMHWLTSPATTWISSFRASISASSLEQSEAIDRMTSQAWMTCSRLPIS